MSGREKLLCDELREGSEDGRVIEEEKGEL